MKHQAEHDSLTELLNRRSFDQLLSLYEKDRSSFALILADVDVFKQINDTCGHDMGDRILKRVAALLHTTFRSIDYVCRIGGDEFAVIMVDMSRELYYTIPDKIAEINGLLAVPEDGPPRYPSAQAWPSPMRMASAAACSGRRTAPSIPPRPMAAAAAAYPPRQTRTAAKAEARRIMTPETLRRQPGGPGAAPPQPMRGIAVKQAKEE